jgi:hypothetical protein
VIFFGAFFMVRLSGTAKTVTLHRRRVGGASGLAKLPATMPVFSATPITLKHRNRFEKKSKPPKLWMLAVALTDLTPEDDWP